MLHLVRFAAGVVTGIVAMQLIKNKSTKKTLEKAQDTLRDATISSLEAIESMSAKARAKLASDEEKGEEAPKKITSHKRSSKQEKAESDQE